ncbi:acid-soluble spore protein N [Metabacillus litoralis]|uniref:Small, acid-soluble spore protein N n=1 Tax=Metabacillus litoralis TaxID=152268 RepID=A0A5C6W7J9_9BACI|nr:acid-soluble spore protein N [Metabacillus litoralis]
MCEEAIRLSNQNDTQTHYNPSHVGMKPRGFGNNKGKKMQDTSGKHAQVIQTKGE